MTFVCLVTVKVGLEARIDRAEWDWNRFKRTKTGRKIALEMAELSLDDDGPIEYGSPEGN